MRRFIRWPGLRPRNRSGVAADVDAEIAAHIDERTELLVREGWTPDAARAEALRRFGDLSETRRSMYTSAMRQFGRVRRRDRLESLFLDIRYIVRHLARTPGFALAVIVTLALGIGANAAMFGVLDRLLLRPPAHVREPDRVVRVYLHERDGAREITTTEVSYMRFKQLREGGDAAIDLAAMYEGRVIAGSGADARQIRAAMVTENFWNLAGVRPVLGRFFAASEDAAPDGAAVAVLGYDQWRAAFGADSSVIGKQVAIGTRQFSIIGVAPAGFTGPNVGRVDVWLPVTSARAVFTHLGVNWQETNNWIWLGLVGRQRSGVSSQQAQALLTTAYQHARAVEADTSNEPSRASVWPLLLERGPERSDATRVAILLGAVALVVLLLACANVANLLLARALQRRAEIAVRLALGVSRGRLVRQLLLESAFLVVLGAVAGVMVATAAGGVFHATLFPGLEIDGAAFDRRVLLFALAASVTATILCGLGPAFYATRHDLRGMLSSSTRTTAHRSRLRVGLLVGQAALSTVLLVGAGLFVRSLMQARSTDLGFDADHMLVVRLDARSAAPLPGGTIGVYNQFIERLRSLPGVRAATTTMQIPFATSGSTDIAVPGVDSVSRFGEFRLNGVGDDYFETTGTRILQGRALTRADRDGSPLVVVVGDSMARILWPGQNALGKCVKVGGADYPCSEVVGVAANVHQYDVRAEPSLQYWFPQSQRQGNNSGAFGVLLRVDGDPSRMVSTIRQALQPLAPASAYISVRPVGESVHNVLRPWRLGAVMFGVFGALGLIIAAVGLYSVLAYSVGQRRREIGVRAALGARRAGVLGMVLSQGVQITGAGIAIGLGIAFAAGGRIAPLLLGIGPRDPVVIGVVALTLLLAAVLASIIPAWRATRVDPSLALRE